MMSLNYVIVSFLTFGCCFARRKTNKDSGFGEEMAKTNAERQREYRERKKLSDPDYLNRERARAKVCRKPAHKLTREEHEKRREMNKIYCRAYRLKKNEKVLDKKGADEILPSTSQTPELKQEQQSSGSTQRRGSTEKLCVALPFMRRKICSTKSVKAKATWRMKGEVKSLKMQLQIARKAKNRIAKRIQRLKMAKQLTPKKHSSETRHTNTPKTQALKEMKNAGVKRSKASRQLFQKLKLTNCLVAEIKSARETNRGINGRRNIASIACGNITKKYRCRLKLNKLTGMTRKQMTQEENVKLLSHAEIRKKALKFKVTKRNVAKFYERDDVSRCMPGKKDAVKVQDEKVQTRILNDYLHNLHDKFNVEHKDAHVSYSTFCRLRPKHVKLTSLLSRNTCLCTSHQNMALKLKSLRTYGVDVSPNPEVVSKSVSIDNLQEKLNCITAEDIEYEQWQKVDVGGKQRMKVVQVSKPKVDFQDMMMKEFEKFLNHCERIRAQYNALQDLKNKLPEAHILIQMDFAENFQCQTGDEIQSAYWNSTMVTLHPVVIYFREDGVLKHKNMVYVSGVNSHNTTAVLAILSKLMPEVRLKFPNVTHVHYWTDSPSSQYRNRYIFHTIGRHQSMFGLVATWNYFEAGHGKSVCDGIGGACKRMAGEAVRQGKVNIQDAKEFFEWAHANERSIAYHFYSQEDYDQAAEVIANMNATVVHGTMKLHAVKSIVNCEILTKTTSCYCDKCIGGYCNTWTIHRTNGGTPASEITEIIEPLPLKEGCFVAALYEQKWYVGQLLTIDNDDNTVEVKFMEEKALRGKSQFRWPAKADILWLESSGILSVIEEPKPVDKYKRFYTISADDAQKIEELLN